MDKPSGTMVAIRRKAMTPWDPEFAKMQLERLRREAHASRLAKAARQGKRGFPGSLFIYIDELMILAGTRLKNRYQANSSQTQAHKSFTLDLG
jgi:hypothetical protein